MERCQSDPGVGLIDYQQLAREAAATISLDLDLDLKWHARDVLVGWHPVVIEQSGCSHARMLTAPPGLAVP